MLIMHLLNKYLGNIEDYKFEKIWENQFLKHKRTYLFITFFYFVLAVGVISNILMFGNDNFVLGLLTMFLVGTIYGGYFLRSFLRFIGTQNARYFTLKTGGFTDTFSKDNVVG